MPIRYGEVRDEHVAVRNDVGVFDVCHMGQIELSGAGAANLARRALTNDPTRVALMRGQYTLLCDDDGGVIDDLIRYALDGRDLLVVNAANVDACLARLRELAGPDVRVEDRSSEFGMLAVQGPNWERVVAPLAAPGDALPARPFDVTAAIIAGAPCLVARTGYTGEPGVELICASDDVGALWDRVTGAEHPATPAGLGSRDTLRLEMGYPLHGNELTRSRTPIAAGLSWAVDLERGAFRGIEALRRDVADPEAVRLVSFVMDDGSIPRSGYRVHRDAVDVGVVTSGGLSPTLDLGIGMAYVPVDVTEAGTQISIEIRGGLHPATVRRRPLVPSSPSKGLP